MLRHPVRRALSLAWIVVVSGSAYVVLEARLDAPTAERVSVAPIEPAARVRPSRPPRTTTTTATTTATTATTVPTPPLPPPPPAPPASPTPGELCTRAIAATEWPAGWRASCAGTRAGLLGLTSPSGTSQVFMRTYLSAGEYALIALHEAGNAWNFARLDALDRQAWCAARGCDAGAFFAGPVHPDGWIEAPGAEDWAEAWQTCHGAAYDRSYIGLGPPSGELCALQRRLVTN